MREQLQQRLCVRFREAFLQTVKKAGMLTTDGSVGVVATGSLSEAHFERILKALPEGAWEFVCHPGHNDLSAIPTRLRESREVELQILISARSRELIRSENIELISYRGLT